MNRSPKSNVRRLAIGRLISVTGGAAAYTALNYTVWERTHSPFMQALSLLLTFGVAGLVGPLTGALGDRFNRRTVMIWSEAISAVFFAAMVFAKDPGLLIALAFGSAIAELPFFSASRAAIPNLVGSDEDLSWANSLVSMGVHAGIAVGPVIGGGLVAILAPGETPPADRLYLAGAVVFGLNTISFVVSLAVTLTVRGRFEEERSSEPQPEHEGVLAGAMYLFRERVLRRMAIAWLVFVLGMGMGMVADAPLAESFGTGGWGFGLLIACWGTGSVLGTVVGRWMNARTEPVWMVFGAAGVAVSAFGVGLFGLFPLVLVSLLVMGTSDGVSIVAENGIMQRRTPDTVRSRTMAALEAVLSLGLAIAYLAAGPMLRVVEAQTVYVIAGVFAVGATFVLFPLIRLGADDGRTGSLGDAVPEPTTEERATV
ncbi:MAG: MFS transporter [Actinomycetota bacterium]|nr:MFS transporter [Actinomycetota bacterium]